jgi:putative NADH-flavin reductase
VTRITVLGGTGYAGQAIATEAARRGHEVRAVARRRPPTPLAGVSYLTGSVTESAFLDLAVADCDVVVCSLSPRGPMLGQVRRVGLELQSLADRLGFRLGVVVGGGSLLIFPDGPALVDTEGFPESVVPEAREMAGVLDDLRSSPVGVDWFAVSPPSGFGAHAPGSPLGHYRLGIDVLLADEAGRSFISAQDLALAVIDEIERPAHKRVRFTVAY